TSVSVTVPAVCSRADSVAFLRTGPVRGVSSASVDVAPMAVPPVIAIMMVPPAIHILFRFIVPLLFV
ncbi:MAG: hypothetical protein M3138_01010, partial [Actinomycetota bacterium]|nr:hypothetical protein [Actinomycetota bacterium]